MTQPTKLGEFELFVLAAVIRLGDHAYGAAIRHDIAERTDREPSLGAIHTTLARMEEKGLVSSHLGEATPIRGGRAKRFFLLTTHGQEVFDRALASFIRMTQGLPGLQGDV